MASTLSDGVGRLHLHRAQRALPVRPHRVERGARGGRPAEALDEARRRRRRCGPTPRRKTISRSSPSASSNGDLERGAGIERRAHPARQPRARHRGRIARACRCGRGTRCGRRSRCAPGRRRRRRRRGRGTRCCRRCARAARRSSASISVTTCIAVLRPQVAQHPFHVAGRREPARPARRVADLQHRELHRARRWPRTPHSSEPMPSSACSKTL